jgi:dolichol-phosphate mannosyltransferase
MSKIVILVPTYNESISIAELLRELGDLRLLSEFDFDLLVIDDNSPDETARIVDNLALPWVNVLHRPKKNGLGEAYRAGFSKVLSNSNYTHVVTMDADGSHRVDDLLRMLNATKGLKEDKTLVMGTRWISGGNVVNWPKYRQLLSKFGTKYAKSALRVDLADLTGGFRIYSSDLLRSLDISEMNATGYCFQIQMALASDRAGADVIEVPITFVERNFGRSKMTLGIAFEAFVYVTKAGANRIWRQYIRR